MTVLNTIATAAILSRTYYKSSGTDFDFGKGVSVDRLECDRMFVAVMETRSFADAAKRLGTSSGQASKLVSRLEAELGRAPAEPDDASRVSRRKPAKPISSASSRHAGRDRQPRPCDQERRTDAARPATSDGSLDLRNGGARVERSTISPCAIAEIELDVSFSDRVVNLVDEGFDVAVRVGRPADTSLIARKLCDVRIVLVGSADYLAEHGEPVGARRSRRATPASSTRTSGSPVAGRFGTPTGDASQSR